MTLRIGSLFTGTGALDLAVMDVYDAEVVWHSQYEPPDKNGKEDKNQYAAKILARHWPTVPNLGDVTAIDWPPVIEEHGPVDILTGGFPCQDVSSAGKRAGLTADSRSGLWTHFARAIHELRPRLVVIENVEGLLSAEADRGLGLDAEALEREARAGRVLRALGAVLGDLATLGFHAEWARVAASEVGAPHPRKRVFIYAWPASADTDGHEPERRGIAGLLGGQAAAESGEGDQRERAGHATGDRGEAAADTAHLGHERGGDARRRGHGPAHGSLAAADATGDAGWLGDGDDVRAGRRADRRGQAARRGAAAEPVCPTCGCDEWMHDAGGFCAGCHGCADPEFGRPDEAAPDTSRLVPGHDGELPAGRHAVQRGLRDDAPRCGTSPTDTDHIGRRADVLQLREGQPDLDWGDYGPAIRRWEHVLGRPAPWPTDALGRLSAVFTEWLMGLPDGWVTDTPGLTRAAMLRALGNGVVRLQAATAIRLLATRAINDATSQQAA